MKKVKIGDRIRVKKGEINVSFHELLKGGQINEVLEITKYSTGCPAGHNIPGCRCELITKIRNVITGEIRKIGMAKCRFEPAYNWIEL